LSQEVRLATPEKALIDLWYLEPDEWTTKRMESFRFEPRAIDMPSLMAGKVHALLARPHIKGRDWYDLLWYRSRRPPEEPNLTLLEAALAQSGIYYDGDWCGTLIRRIADLDFDGIARDLSPFLEHHEDARLITAENLTRLLKSLE